MELAQQLHKGDVWLSPHWQNRALVALKRALDVCTAAFLLIVLFPLFALLALLVKISSRGPVLYRWRVVGKGGRAFVSYKFRSMVANADELKTSLLDKNEMTGPVFKLTRDPRVTIVGAWLR